MHHKEVVEVLLRRDADVMAMDNNGEILLHWATDKGYKAVVMALINHEVHLKQVLESSSSHFRRASYHVMLLFEREVEITMPDRIG